MRVPGDFNTPGRQTSSSLIHDDRENECVSENLVGFLCIYVKHIYPGNQYPVISETQPTNACTGGF